MSRFVLFYGKGTAITEDVARIKGMKGVTVIEETGPRALLVEASEAAIHELKELLPDWAVSAETSYPVPGPFRVKPVGRGQPGGKSGTD